MSGAQQTSDAHPATTDGQGNVNGSANATPSVAADPNAEAIRIISESTGRKYQSLEDATKHLKHLNSFVGNPRLREDAALADRIVNQYADENGISRQEARSKLSELAGSEKPQQQRTDDGVPEHVKDRIERLETDAFLARNPNAEAHLEKVRTYARATGKELADAYEELYGTFQQASVSRNDPAADKRSQKMATSVSVSTTSVPAATVSKLDQLKAQYAKNGDPRLMREIIKAKADREA